MSVQATSWAFTASVNTPVERLLLIWLAERVNQDGYFSTSPLVGAEPFCCATTEEVQAAFDALVAARLVQLPDNAGRLAMALEFREPRLDRWAPSARLRAYLIKAAGGVCVACGSDDRLAIDHIIPRSRGGSNDPSNLQVLCLRCNSSKRDKEDWSGRA